MIEYPDADRLMAGELGEWLQGQRQVRQDAIAQSHDRLFKSGLVLLPLAAFLFILAPLPLEPKFWITAIAAGGAGRGARCPSTRQKSR